jgi:hypothetical protein
MAVEESNVSNKVQLAASKLGAVLFRNNRGKFRTLDGKRIVTAGLSINGSSDLIGWHTVEVSPDMVGSRVALFLAVEVKTEKGVISTEQQRFVDNVNAAGGIGFIARNDLDVDALLKSHYKKE